MANKRKQTTIRLSPSAKEILNRVIEKSGLNQTEIIEKAIYEYASEWLYASEIKAIQRGIREVEKDRLFNS